MVNAPRRLSKPISPFVLDGVVASVAMVVDLGLTAAFSARQPDLVGPGVVGYALVALGALCLVGRRRWPRSTLALTLSSTMAYFGLGYVNGPAVVPSIIALYTVAVVSTRRASILAGLITIAGIVAAKGVLAPDGWLNPVSEGVPAWAAAALFLGLAVRNHRAYVAAVEERARRAEQSRHDHAERLLDAQRLRIAHELHDVVSHSIATMTLQAGGALTVFDDRPELAREALQAIKAAGAETLGELRGILGVLRDPDDPQPLKPSPGLSDVDSLVATITQAGLHTEIAVVGEPRPLPATLGLAGYRIIQEGLTNALRHAGPVTAQVTITYRQHDVLITVDNSPPPVPADTPRTQRAGLGIIGMRERAGAVGGTLDVGPSHDGGFSVAARLPLHPVQS